MSHLMLGEDFIDDLRQRFRERRLALAQASGVRPGSEQHLTWVGDLQQGDGGKGAMTDRLAAIHQVLVRVQGGDNAGHTTVFVDERGKEMVVKNHLLPSGLRQPDTIGILGNGVLINAETLVMELEAFAEHCPGVEKRVFISRRAHLVLPLHRLVDSRDEDTREQAALAIGTTRRGIGPANVSKVNRCGIRVVDLRDWATVEQRVRQNVTFFGLDDCQVDENLAWIASYSDLLLERSTDTTRLISDLVATGHSVLFEGAQGPLIDLEHGLYPYVTTSPTAFHSVSVGTGFDGTRIQHRVGVLKVYQTMVGAGAFVSESDGALGERLRQEGSEFGTTTGRARRCGWLDLVHARWAAELNGFSSVVLTKLDVLDTFEEIGICVAYELDGELQVEFDAEHAELSRATPVYRYFPGWRCSTRDVTTYADLPVQAREFADFIGRELRTEIGGVTKGPRDIDMLVRPGTRLASLVGAR